METYNIIVSADGLASFGNKTFAVAGRKIAGPVFIPDRHLKVDR